MTSGLNTLDARPAVRVDRVNHYYGDGESRNQVLFNNCLEIGAGQLVVMTGPSGSGKTTLLSLIGGLRSVQAGSIEILDHSLTGLSRHDLVDVRRNLGFIFQAHNLFDSLSAYENVKMAMQLSDCPPDAMRERGMKMLERLGLAYEDLKEANPRIVTCGIRGFLSGPYETRNLLDEPAQMMGGLAYMTGPPGMPLRAGASVIDITGAMFSVIGILSALLRREHTGAGDNINTGLFETVVFIVLLFVAFVYVWRRGALEWR